MKTIVFRLLIVLFLLFCGLGVDLPTEIVVRPTEVDSKGHVNNAKYVEYLQWGRWDWLDRHGFTDERLASQNCVLVVANLNINYRREAKRGEHLFISAVVKKVGEKSFTVAQKVQRSGDEIVADAEVVLVAIDPMTRKSRLLPGELKKFLEP